MENNNKNINGKIKYINIEKLDRVKSREEETNYKPSFFVVPYHITELPGLTLPYLRVYETIFQFWNKGLTCFLSNAAIMERTGIKSLSTIHDAFQYFEKLNEMKRITIDGQRYTVQPERKIKTDSATEGGTATPVGGDRHRGRGGIATAIGGGSPRRSHNIKKLNKEIKYKKEKIYIKKEKEKSASFPQPKKGKPKSLVAILSKPPEPKLMEEGISTPQTPESPSPIIQEMVKFSSLHKTGEKEMYRETYYPQPTQKKEPKSVVVSQTHALEPPKTAEGIAPWETSPQILKSTYNLTDEDIDAFEVLWKMYPNKANKLRAQHLWFGGGHHKYAEYVLLKLQEQIEKDVKFIDGYALIICNYITNAGWADEIRSTRPKRYTDLDNQDSSWATDKYKSIFD